VWFPPVREAILTEESSARAREMVRGLCDAVDLPSSRARALLEDLTSGRSFFGAEGFLPAFYQLESLASYLPTDSVILLEDPPAITRAVREERDRAASDRAAKSKEPVLPLDDLYASEAAVTSWLSERRVVALHRSSVAGGQRRDDLERFEAAAEDTPSLARHDQADLERAIAAARSSRGKDRALDPLLTRLKAWREAGLTTFVAARTETQAERLVSLIRHRDVPCQARTGRFDPRILGDLEVCGQTLVVVGPLARGVIALSEGLAFVTEEEIFGQRAHRGPKREGGRKNRQCI
jgi:transcription-repair coupling factor (superfamily II helicase)